MKQLLSPRKVAAAIGVSESTLKRWADEGLIKATRTAGGHRRIPVTEAIRFVRETQARIVDPTILGLSDVEGLAESPLAGSEDRIEQMLDALTSGRSTRVRGIITQLFLDGMLLTELCDDVIGPTMHRIGLIWRDREDGIFLEHRATDMCLHALHHVQTLIAVDDGAPAAVGGAPPNDPYLIPTLMSSLCLRDAGIRALSLGGDTPLDALIHAADHAQARLAWVSISAPPAPELTEQLNAFAANLETRGACLVIGGREASRYPVDPRPNVYKGENMRELVAFARGVLVTDRLDESTEPAHSEQLIGRGTIDVTAHRD